MIGEALVNIFLITIIRNKKNINQHGLFQAFKEIFKFKKTWLKEDLRIFSIKRKFLSKAKQLAFLNNKIRSEPTKLLNYPFAKLIARSYYRYYKNLPRLRRFRRKKVKNFLKKRPIFIRVQKKINPLFNDRPLQKFFIRSTNKFFRIKLLYIPFVKKAKRCFRVAMSDFRVSTRKHHRKRYRRFLRNNTRLKNKFIYIQFNSQKHPLHPISKRKFFQAKLKKRRYKRRFRRTRRVKYLSKRSFHYRKFLQKKTLIQSLPLFSKLHQLKKKK